MTVHDCSGLSAMLSSACVAIRRVLMPVLLGIGAPLHVLALPELDLTELDSLEALAPIDAAWTAALLGEQQGTLALDENIFTDLSPITESVEGVRLPEDQQLSE